ncbi:putative pectate lyase 7, partial [Mucuna pruriens]
MVIEASDDDMVNPKSGTLCFAIELLISSSKTIDGRGVNVQIKNGGGLTMQYMNNVIIHGT